MNNAVWAQSFFSPSKTSTLAPELRLKPFSDTQGIAFRNILKAAYTAREIRDAAVDGKLRESHIVIFNKRFPGGEIKIHREIETGNLSSGEKYALAVFEFTEEKKQINVLLLKDHAHLTVGDREELKKFGVKNNADINHLNYPGLEGVWFINSTATPPSAKLQRRDESELWKEGLKEIVSMFKKKYEKGFADEVAIFVERMERIGIIRPGHRVLDIGPGAFLSFPAVVLAVYGCEIDIVQPDSQALSIYMETAHETCEELFNGDEKLVKKVMARIHPYCEGIGTFLSETNTNVMYNAVISMNVLDILLRLMGKGGKSQVELLCNHMADNAFMVVGTEEDCRSELEDMLKKAGYNVEITIPLKTNSILRGYSYDYNIKITKGQTQNADLKGSNDNSDGSETNLRSVPGPLVSDAKKPKGSCADCLNSIAGDDALLEKALTEGLDIETELKPVRLKLKNPDQPFSDTTRYYREVNTLVGLGILIRLPDGRIKFSDIMIKPDNKGPPDKEYTKNLISRINEIEYPIGQKGPYKNKPLHRGEIPLQIRPKIKELILKIAQPPADGSGYGADLPAANAVRFLLEDGFLSLEEFQKITDEPSLKSFGTHAMYKEILIRRFFDKETETTIVGDLQRRGIAIKKISSTTFMRWLARIYSNEIIKDKLQRIRTNLPYIPQANNIRRMLEFRYGLYDDGKPLHKNETAVKIGRTLPYVEARLKIALPLMKTLMSGENDSAAKQLSSFAKELRPGKSWTSELIKKARKEIWEIINKLVPGLAKTELTEEYLSARPARTTMGADKHEYIVKYTTAHLHKMAVEKTAWGDAAKRAVQSLNALNDYVVIYPDKLLNMAYELKEAIDDASKKYPDGIKEHLRKKLLKILDAFIRNSPLYDLDELDGDYSGDPVSPFGSPALNTPYIVNQILEDNPNISFDDLLNKIAEHLGVSSITDLKAYPNLKEEIKEHLAAISRPRREMITEAAHGTAGKDSGLAKIDINTASPEELQRLFAEVVSLSEKALRGLMRRVIDERAKEPFVSLADIVNRVKGIGSSTAERLRAHILITGKPIARSLPVAAKRRNIIFTNHMFESANDKLSKLPAEIYHDIIRRALLYDNGFVSRTLNAMGLPDTEKFISYKKAEVTFLGIGTEARVYKVILWSEDDKAEFVITIGERDRRIESEEAEEDKRDGFSPRILKNEFDNLMRMNSKFPENIVKPYAYGEIESENGSVFPLYSARFIRDYDGFRIYIDGNKLRAANRVVSDRLWQMEGIELRKLLKDIFKIRIKLFLEFRENFAVYIPSGDFIYPSQRNAASIGPSVRIDGSIFKTIAHDTTRPIILTAAIASIECDEAYMAFALIGEGQVLLLKPFHDTETVVIPTHEAITALADSLSEIFPIEGKKKTAEWLKACLAQHGDKMPPDVIALIRKSIDDLSKSESGDTLNAGEEAYDSARKEAVRIHEADIKPEYMPAIPKETILCHIITDSILPEGQRNMLKTLEQNMRGDEYSEKIVSLSIDDPDNFVEELGVLMAKQRELHEGYVVNFDIACPNTGIVTEILESNLGVKAIAFEPCKEADVVQVEGIILALRALDSGKIESLREAFRILAGKDIPQELSAVTDINELIKRITFTLPAAKLINYDHIRQLNEIIRKNIESAA